MKRARSSSPDRLSQLPRAGPSSAGTSPAVLEKQHQQQHQQQHVVRASTVIQQAQRCCSEISDGTLICCDSPDCVQDDDADTLTSVNDDCAECMNAVESGCTEDCVVVEDATQCQECVKDPPTPSEAVKDLKSSSQTQKSGHDRTLSATDAFDAEEPIKACDVPGCDASLEWDEKAMDELLRCCCNGSGTHHHQSFIIPSSHAHLHSHSHSTGHQHHPRVHVEPAHASIEPPNHKNRIETEQENAHAHNHSHPESQAFHAHHHFHGHDHAGHHHFIALPNQVQSMAHTTDINTNQHYHQQLHHHSLTSHVPQVVNNFAFPPHQHYQFNSGPLPAASLQGFTSPALPVNSTNNYTSQPSSSTSSHSRSQSTPAYTSTFASDNATVLEPSTAITASATASPVFRCQWTDCSSTFPTREELVGHVTVAHLLQATPVSPNFPPPPPVETALLQLSNPSTAAGSNGMHGGIEPFSNSFPAISTSQNNTFTHLQNQPTDASFDHTLRCLWDSCEASLPIHDPHLSGNHNDQGTNQYSHTHSQSVNGAVSHASPTQHLPDQSTATLVRHLLQDHLHLPTDVLGQLSPGLPMPLFNADAMVPYLPSSDTLPSSTHSTPHLSGESMSTSHTPKSLSRSGIDPSPVSFTSLPTPPPATADQQFRFDFGPSAYTDLKSSTAPDQEGDIIMQATNISGEDEKHVQDDKEDHTCHWNGCSATFDNTSDLMDHISTTHVGGGKSMYFCEWEGCERAQEGRGFNQRQKVMRHVRTHVGDKPFVCSECGRAFSESTTLAQHMRTHTNEKPFACPEPGCGKSFALQSALTIHMRTHTGEKPFKCPYPGCGMAFAESSNLSKHAKTHIPKRALGRLGGQARGELSV